MRDIRNFENLLVVFLVMWYLRRFYRCSRLQIYLAPPKPCCRTPYNYHDSPPVVSSPGKLLFFDPSGQYKTDIKNLCTSNLYSKDAYSTQHPKIYSCQKQPIPTTPRWGKNDLPATTFFLTNGTPKCESPYPPIYNHMGISTDQKLLIISFSRQGVVNLPLPCWLAPVPS